jgi:hypothetical protein
VVKPCRRLPRDRAGLRRRRGGSWCWRGWQRGGQEFRPCRSRERRGGGGIPLHNFTRASFVLLQNTFLSSSMAINNIICGWSLSKDHLSCNFELLNTYITYPLGSEFSVIMVAQVLVFCRIFLAFNPCYFLGDVSVHNELSMMIYQES